MCRISIKLPRNFRTERFSKMRDIVSSKVLQWPCLIGISSSIKP